MRNIDEVIELLSEIERQFGLIDIPAGSAKVEMTIYALLQDAKNILNKTDLPFSDLSEGNNG